MQVVKHKWVAGEAVSRLQIQALLLVSKGLGGIRSWQWLKGPFRTRGQHRALGSLVATQV